MGCGGNKETKPEPKAGSQTPSVEWYQDNLKQAVEKVGTDNADKILKSAGLTAHKVSDGTDNKGEPKKIYAINNGLTAQLEHSPNNVIIAWYQAEEAKKKAKRRSKTLIFWLGRCSGKMGQKWYAESQRVVRTKMNWLQGILSMVLVRSIPARSTSAPNPSKPNI